MSTICPLCGSAHDAERSFPILHGGKGVGIPWRVVAPHGRQAEKNHYQTLERLAQRGGLAWSEMAAVLQDRDWHKMDDQEARKAVLGFCVPDPSAATITRLEQEVERLREALEQIDKLLGACVRLAETGGVKINPESVSYQAAVTARRALEQKG